MKFIGSDNLQYEINKVNNKSEFWHQILTIIHSLWWDCDFKSMENSLTDVYSPDGLPETYAVTYKGELAGFCSLLRSDTLYRQDIFPWFGNCYVFEKFRHKGIMSKMQNYCCELAKQRGLSKIFLWTADKDLYIKCGWIYLEDILVNKKTTAHLFYKNIE